MITTTTFPSTLKQADVIPVYRKGNKDNSINERVFERVILIRITKCMEKHNILPEYQDGFRPERSTKDVVFDLKNLLNKKKSLLCPF